MDELGMVVFTLFFIFLLFSLHGLVFIVGWVHKSP